MLPLFRLVEMPVFDEHLAEGIIRMNELPVSLHQDRLSLRGIIRLVVFRRAGQFLSRAADIIQPADFGRAARHPDIARPELVCKRGDAGIVEAVGFALDERHRADLSHQFYVKPIHSVTIFSSARL